MPRGKPPVDFQDVVNGYNIRNSTKYTLAEFLDMAYRENGRLSATAEWIGVSVKTLSDQMHRLQIPVRPQNGGFHGRPTVEEKILAIPLEKMESMSSGDIQDLIGSHLTSINTVLKKNSLKYAKYKWRKPYSHKSLKRDAILQIPEKEIAEMTPTQIAKRVGADRGYTCTVLKKYRIKYRHRSRP